MYTTFLGNVTTKTEYKRKVKKWKSLNGVGVSHSVLEHLISSTMEFVLAFGAVFYLFTCQAGDSFKSFVSKVLGASKGFLQARKGQKYGILTGKEWSS